MPPTGWKTTTPDGDVLMATAKQTLVLHRPRRSATRPGADAFREQIAEFQRLRSLVPGTILRDGDEDLRQVAERKRLGHAVDELADGHEQGLALVR